MRSGKIDKLFLGIFILLIFVGFLIFSSASLGLLAREGETFSNVAIKQFFAAIVLGSLVLFITMKIPFSFWKKNAFLLLCGSIFLTILVFVPHVGWSHGGAKRWVALGPISFQPSEFLKIGMLIYFAAWLAKAKDKISQYSHGLIPLCTLLGISAVLMLLEPDTGTFLVIFFTLIGMYLVARGPWRDILILAVICVLGVGVLFFYRPYIKERILTFTDPSRDPQGAGYQIQQSLIAIGSGGVFGRGFGQSVQKFSYLPEPIGDSIFAVAGEEFGIAGTLTLIILYLLFAFRGLRIASQSKDSFGGLLACGIVILIISESFINIASMLGLLPLTGIPLIFVSHGGTAALLAMAEVGIILNISKQTI